MIAVQKPPLPLSFTPSFRPSHSRHPSAPVVVRPTHTPGLLSLLKPSQPTPRPQPVHHQLQQRPQRSPRGKPQQRSPQAAQAQAAAASNADAKKPSVQAPKADAATPEKARSQATALSSSRGRQSNKPAKDKAPRRSVSSSSRIPARRPPHQPSPPPNTRIPSQAEVPHPPVIHKRPPAAAPRDVHPNLFDPFVVNSTSDSETSPRDPAGSAKAGAKPPAFRTPPKLAQPSGKLARRRQLNTQAPSTPTPPKAVPVPRCKERAAPIAPHGDASRSDPVLSTSTPRRVKHSRCLSTSLPVADWDFPVCDDSADQADDSDTPPTTPIRETASVPAKKAPWQRMDAFGNVPHSAPLSSTFGFPFVLPSPAVTPTPAQRRRNHRRAPSEGMFHMSMDEDSSSSSELFDSFGKVPIIPRRRVGTEPRQRTATVEGMAASAPEAGYYAGSMFQNSPSPDDLPAPSF
ncbi:hypothetical protein AcW1_009730 [Taiwanofungus camphoratus]|nr:hypothetical protein AcW1_009730 [Antrodia cinnamomea]